MAKQRALVIGGSVGGLFAANLLRTIGWDVTVFERAADHLGDRGTGIGTRDELFAVMRRIGLPADASIGVPVHGRIALARDGSVIHELPVRAVTSAWAHIWRPLRQALPDDSWHGGHTLARVEQTERSVAAIFSDGTRAEGGLLVAADGLHSTVRAQLLPRLAPHYAGYVAWRGVVHESAVDPALHGTIFHHMMFGFPDGELLLSLPMPGPNDGPRRGERSCHFVWFRPAGESELADLCTDATGRRHGVSIPPPLIRSELVAEVKAAADALLAPQLASLLRSTSQIILQPIFDLESPCIAFGRVALLGDAAFVARPHVATGVMKAALDAQSLTDAISATGSDVAAALRRYNTERQPFGAWLVERGRHIGASITAPNADQRQRTETIMREYGAAGMVGGQPIGGHAPD